MKQLIAKNLKIVEHTIFADNKPFYTCKAVVNCVDNYKVIAFGSQYYCETVINNIRANNTILKGIY